MKKTTYPFTLYFRILFLVVILMYNFTNAQATRNKELNRLVTQFEEEILFSHDKASKTANFLINKAENENTEKAKAIINYIKAKQLLIIDKKPNAANFFAKKAYKLHEELKDSVSLYKDIHSIYECYVDQKKYDSAAYYANKELIIAKKLNIPSYRATANLAIGEVYYWTRQYNKAIQYRKKALHIANTYQLKKILSDIHIRMTRSYVIPSNQRTKKILDSAIYHAKKSLLYAKETNYTYGIYKSTVMLADMLNTDKQHKEALTVIETVIDLPKEKRPLSLSYNAPFYYAVILKDNKNYTKAKKIAKQLISSLEPNDYRNKKSTYFFLTALYAHDKQPDSSDYFLKQAIIANNAHAKSKMEGEIAELQTQYETEKKEQQIKNLEQKRRLEQLELKELQRQRILLIVIPVILFIGWGAYVKRRRLKLQLEAEQKERSKQLSELKALRAQMNPHFMFNALSSIQDFILLDQTNEAGTYLGNFSQLMRGYLDASRKEIITLDREIELLKIYIELEGLRIGNSFKYNLEVDTNIDTETIEIPPLLIQPYVENAFKHGFIHKKGNKKLDVIFQEIPIDKQSALKITIRDNGIGRDKSAEINAKKHKMHTSFATQATQKRLTLLNSAKAYHKNITITTKDLYTKENNPSGTEVIITITL